jgi:hypothetical protein
MKSNLKEKLHQNEMRETVKKFKQELLNWTFKNRYVGVIWFGKQIIRKNAPPYIANNGVWF